MLLGHLLPQQGRCEITLNCFLLCVMLWVPYPLEIWIAVMKRRDFLEVIATNGRIILK